MDPRNTTVDASGTKTVIIGCKLPHGYVLELVTPHAFETSTMPAPTGPRVELAGANSLRIARTNPHDHVYATTEVPQEFWDKWVAMNPHNEPLKKGMIFVAANAAQARGEIKDRQGDIKTGLEPINPDGDKRFEHGVETNKDGGAVGAQRARAGAFGTPS